ncbi:MAG: GreA/GreB family elongation factor [Lentisphaeria bacterium]|nr:GreA/GreB family elongation factor [Lentisphaeria bacterium]
MDIARLDELMLAVMGTPRQDQLNALKDFLAAVGKPVPEEVAERLETLWEEWSAAALSAPMAKFALDVALLGVPGKVFFRKVLTQAVKVLLPPYLNHAPVIKAVGVRNEQAQTNDIAMRFSRLLAIKNGCILFLPASRRWGVAGALDSINASLPLMPFGIGGSNAVVPLEVILQDAVVLSSGPEVIQLAEARTAPISSERFRAIVAKRSTLPVSDAKLKLMAQCGCAKSMDGAAFEKYWNTAAAAPAAAASAAAPVAAGAKPGTRRACDGRSLKEVDMLLDAECSANCGKFTDDEIAAFHNFFDRLKADTAKRESKLLATIIAKISDRAADENLAKILSPLTGKTSFFPANPAESTLAAFEVWGELSSKLLEKLSSVAAQIFDEDYLAACATKLPLKALNCLCAHISDEAICDMVQSRRCGADLLLWIWKNRKKRSGSELLELVNLDNVSRILSGEEPPKAWGAARREMRTMLMDDQAFQSHLIAMLGGDTIMFGSLLQSALFLSSGERQSLMVKLARQSKELQEYLESGAGQKILNAGIGKTETVAAVPVHEPSYTSVKSHKALIKELDDIINIHVPENREALKTARAHGDFRENSEFDAAKERRNYLSRRRSELERELANIQPVVMKQVEVSNTAVIGSEIEIQLSDGKKEVYYLLGAWDGDPDRRFLSYRTRLGKAVMNCRAGDNFDGPDGKAAKLLAVRPLPEAVIAELDV